MSWNKFSHLKLSSFHFISIEFFVIYFIVLVFLCFSVFLSFSNNEIKVSKTKI